MELRSRLYVPWSLLMVVQSLCMLVDPASLAVTLTVLQLFKSDGTLSRLCYSQAGSKGATHF